jgi:hypothetical protein
MYLITVLEGPKSKIEVQASDVGLLAASAHGRGQKGKKACVHTHERARRERD